MRSPSNSNHRETIMDQQQKTSPLAATANSPHSAVTSDHSLTTPSWIEDEVVISRAHHNIDGVNQGSLSDLQFRPNASFHPIREVNLDQDHCILLFDRPIRRVDRSVSRDEVLLLIHSIRRGERELALGQAVYLYPSVEAFGLSSQGKLRIVLRNCRPKGRYEKAGRERITVLAFLQLIEAHAPQLWVTLSPISHQLSNIQQLEEALETSSVLKKIMKGVWRLSLYLLFCLSYFPFPRPWLPIHCCQSIVTFTQAVCPSPFSLF